MVPVLLGVNVWEEICEPQAIAEKVAEAGFAGAVNFPSCMHFSHSMQQLLARAGRGIAQEVAVLQAVQQAGLTSLFYCATRPQPRRAAHASPHPLSLNPGWHVGAPTGHPTPTPRREATPP